MPSRRVRVTDEEACLTERSMPTPQLPADVSDVDRTRRRDTAALARHLPRGKATVRAVKGGQNVANPAGNETHVIATAAIEAYLPNQSAGWQASAN